MRQPHVLTVSAVLLLAACSSSNDAAPATTHPSTTAAPGTTARPATTSPPTSTTAPTATPPPTTPPETTPPPTPPPTTAPRDIIAEVTQAALAYDDWYVECLRHPADCDPSLVSPEGSDASANLSALARQLAAAGLFVGSEEPGYVVVENVEVLDDHVAVSVCGWGTMVLYGPPGPDGRATVQNDTPSTVREVWQFVEQDGAWMIRRADTTEEIEGVNECPPEA